jgi:uncharacterized RDD family membrane protein YckC
MIEDPPVQPDVDPYRPPTSNVEVPAGARPIVRASRWRRFGTFIVDQVGIVALAFVVGMVIVLIFGQPGLDALERVPDLVFGPIVITTYYVFFEGLWARSPAKLLFGTVVVDEQGLRPRFRQIVGRTLCRFIPFEAISFFASRGWHDRIPRTYVVLTRPSEAAVRIAQVMPRELA